MGFTVFTDTSANLPTSLVREMDIRVLPFSYFIDGVEFQCLDTEGFDGASFYGAIRRGTRVTTSLVSPDAYNEGFRQALEAGSDVVYVGMSSGISGSYGCSKAAADLLREEYPQREIYVIDSFSASLGEGLLAVRAAQMRDQDFTARQAADVLEEMKVGMCQVFTVDDLMYLRRTGRLSNAAALIATVLNIKPLLKGNEYGQIVSFAKVRGRRRSVEAIAANYDALVEKASEQVVGIAHADCREDAEHLISLLKKNNPPGEIMLVDFEPVTGSHVGPGALALFFMGSREFRSGKAL